MYHVKGLGQITQEFAYPVLFLRFYHTTGTKIDDNWENDDNANSIINPVHPSLLSSPYSRHVKYNR